MTGPVLPMASKKLATRPCRAWGRTMARTGWPRRWTSRRRRDPVQDGVEVTAAERLVHLPGRRDVLPGAHDLAPPFQEAGQAQYAATAAGSPTNCSISAHAAALHGHEHDLRAVHRAPVGAAGAEPHQHGNVALAVGHDRLRLGVQRAGGEQRRLQVGDDRIGAAPVTTVIRSASAQSCPGFPCGASIVAARLALAAGGGAADCLGDDGGVGAGRSSGQVVTMPVAQSLTRR